MELKNMFNHAENYSSTLRATSFIKIDNVIFGLTFLLKKNVAYQLLQFKFMYTQTRGECKQYFSKITAKGTMTTKATAWR